MLVRLRVISIVLCSVLGGAESFAHDDKVRIPLPTGGEVTGRLFLPSTDGPYPAVVALHGCSGMLTATGKLKARERYWAERLNAAGFAVVFPDSFTERGYQSICQVSPRPIHPDKERVVDAYAALNWLQQRSDIRADAIALMGWSNGAMAALSALSDKTQFRPVGLQYDFQAGVLFYPGCFQIHRKQPSYKSIAPLLMQLGADDTWTPARYCVRMANSMKTRQAGPIEWDVYDGVRHSFDDPKGKPKSIVVRNEVYASGQKVVTIGPNAKAREAATLRSLRWLERYVSTLEN